MKGFYLANIANNVPFDTFDTSHSTTNPLNRAITYDGDNMPIRIVHANGATVDFVYDGVGKRTKKLVQSGKTVLYLGDHFEVENGVNIKYIFGGNLRLAQIKGSLTSSSTSYFHKDHLGSTAAVTNEAGVKVESTTYEPFGSTRTQEGAVVSAYKFTDQELDNETNLYNYDARLYDPVLGMFVTPDSIVPRMFDPQMLNGYAYCRNNPLIYIDPSGHTLNNTEINSNDGEKDDKWPVQTDKAWEKACLTEMQANINKKFQKYLKKTRIQICANSEEYFEYPIANTWDPKTNKRINKLDPAIQAMATAHINFLNEEYGSKVRLSSGLRTYKEQFDIYLQGRLSPGKVATNAPPGYSAHEYGLGYDLDFISGNYCSPGTIGRAGIAAGFDWGGNFKSIDDPRHFEVTTLYQKEVIWAGYSFNKKAKEMYGNWCVFLGRVYGRLIFQ